MNSVPPYDELPTIEQIGIRHSWDHLDPTQGSLAFLSEQSIAAAAHRVLTGEVISLSLRTDELDPPLFGRPVLDHEVQETARNTYEDVLGEFNPQAASQWDGLLHIRAREFGFFGGETDLERARTSVGVHHWGARGIVGRGVLVDVPAALGERWDPMAGDVLEPEELLDLLAGNQTPLQRGDILCIRLGWLERYRALKAESGTVEGVDGRFSGLASNDRMVRFLWNAGVAAIVCDNPAVESAPGDRSNGSLHRKLIPGLGFALAELADLDLLAQRCHDRGRYDFFFAAAPLPLSGGASSPLNALAVL